MLSQNESLVIDCVRLHVAANRVVDAHCTSPAWAEFVPGGQRQALRQPAGFQACFCLGCLRFLTPAISTNFVACSHR